jgi:molybdate transport system substrate-binding protein
MRTWSKWTAVAAGCCLTVAIAGAAAPAGVVNVAVGGGPVPGIMTALAATFERDTGTKVVFVSKRGDELTAAIKEGDVDLVVSDAALVDGLVKSGDIVAASKTPVMTSKIGLAVKAGSPKPDISTPEKLKAALLAANKVSYSKFASGQIFLKAVERLGITDAVTAKAVFPQNGEPVGAVIVRGDADIGVQQVAELMAVPGTDLLGGLPGDLQQYIPTVGGISTKAKNAEAARAFLTFLRSNAATTVLKQKGMDVP